MRVPAQLDRVDRQLLHALGVNGRVSFRHLASALDTTEHTVARRYRRLVEQGVVRVVAVEPPQQNDHGQLLRLAVHPGSGSRLANALARRDDVSWIRTAGSGAELLCGVRAGSPDSGEHLILDQLPKTGRVIRVTSYAVLHHFHNPGHADWEGFPDPLTEQQRNHIGSTEPRTEEPSSLTSDDAVILAALGPDARQTSARIAQTTGQPESTIRRRIEQLLTSGAIRLDRDLAPAALGYTVTATLYIDVAPARLHEAGNLLTQHAETTFVAAVTGPTNLYAAVAVRTLHELYDYVTTTLAEIDGILRVETSRTSSYLKHTRTVSATRPVDNLPAGNT